MEEKSKHKIYCISDTHGFFDSELDEHLRDADHIFHTGDIGDLNIIEHLKLITNTHVVSGNIDGFTRSGYPIFYRIELYGYHFLLSHIGIIDNEVYHRVQTEIQRSKTDIVVFGHSHQPFSGKINGIRYFNPGSCGPKREDLPRCFGSIEIKDNDVKFELHYLKEQDYPIETH